MQCASGVSGNLPSSGGESIKPHFAPTSGAIAGLGLLSDHRPLKGTT
jgi:hypothetical protein